MQRNFLFLSVGRSRSCRTIQYVDFFSGCACLMKLEHTVLINNKKTNKGLDFSFCHYSLLTMSDRREEFLQQDDVFRRNAFEIIDQMLNMSVQTEEDTTELVDEVLHSILFLGNINRPQYSPENIFSDREMLENLRTYYPRPFDLYSKQLPKRTPFSCVLDMVVNLIGQDKTQEIQRKLQQIRGELRGRRKPLASFVICVSHSTDSINYYGVSMSSSGNSTKIMVAASCLNVWDIRVADAVMTYYTFEPSFDGTIRLPTSVACLAFKITTGEEMKPCRLCENLFGLGNDERTEENVENKWPYGNCAEVESLSNLFKNEEEVKDQVRPTAETWTDENRQEKKVRVLNHLRDLLRNVGETFRWDDRYYEPQNVV